MMDPMLERTFRGHKNYVTSTSFSPSLKQVLLKAFWQLHKLEFTVNVETACIRIRRQLYYALEFPATVEGIQIYRS